ncbi:hypothetical protein Bca4012_060860 [Brassica carinata]
MWVRFNGCRRSREVGSEDGILRVCFSNDGIVAWKLALVPSGVHVSGVFEAAGSVASRFEGAYLSARGNCLLVSGQDPFQLALVFARSAA